MLHSGRCLNRWWVSRSRAPRSWFKNRPDAELCRLRPIGPRSVRAQHYPC
ncbi:hypothetical protein MCA1698 [Methylococcus capsulatus str. Bath]|uniref:Uncharacterized protein n=1 Tax=Methylococcus capsulatus (strain ATCC 33009 / NCIMB 11132 / Bath) TaxID=243233 RepID=Q607Q7_METCA|nr:hypothetical protein MCA1698 [Methylococcus capsulatus str. Bath]